MESVNAFFNRQRRLGLGELVMDQDGKLLGHHVAHANGFILGIGGAGDGRDMQGDHFHVGLGGKFFHLIEIAAKPVGDAAGRGKPRGLGKTEDFMGFFRSELMVADRRLQCAHMVAHSLAQSVAGFLDHMGAALDCLW